MATAPNNQAMDVVIEWLNAMRRGDRDAIAECFRPNVTWRGIVSDAVCHDRTECSRTALPSARRGPRRSS
jgi:hypothetical protein